MSELNYAKECDLHVHMIGAFYADQVIEMARDIFEEIDWDWANFVEKYQEAYGMHPEPEKKLRTAFKNKDFQQVRKLHIFSDEDCGDFQKWSAKSKFLACVWHHWRMMGRTENLIDLILERHKDEGLKYVEYRCRCSGDGFEYWHTLIGDEFKRASDFGLTARYILSLPKVNPMEDYRCLQRLFDKFPEYIPIFVGLDFAGSEEGLPPKMQREFFNTVESDNQRKPDRALDIVYHVGESFYDKSIESAIRWCHEVAEMGAARIAHAIALGLDPAIAIERRTNAHEKELVSERLDQIAYDLKYSAYLAQYNIEVNVVRLKEEEQELRKMSPSDKVEYSYNKRRIQEIRQRQKFVIDHLCKMGTVIECCPISNMRIGGIPEPIHHPIHKFLDSQLNLAICTDDPGNFDAPLAQQLDWVLKNTKWNSKDLAERLGDPKRFCLGQTRRPVQ